MCPTGCLSVLGLYWSANLPSSHVLCCRPRSFWCAVSCVWFLAVSRVISSADVNLTSLVRRTRFHKREKMSPSRHLGCRARGGAAARSASYPKARRRCGTLCSMLWLVRRRSGCASMLAACTVYCCGCCGRAAMCVGERTDANRCGDPASQAPPLF